MEEAEKVDVGQCHLDELRIAFETVKHSFVNGDQLYPCNPKDDEEYHLEYLQLAEPLRASQILPTVAKWIDSNFEGYVKVLGCVVDNKSLALSDRKVLGLVCEPSGDTFQSFISENTELRADHKMFLATTVFQAWQHSLYLGPCLPVFTLENILVKKGEERFLGKIRLQFPTESYKKAIGVETLDSNVCQLADVPHERIDFKGIS